MKYVATINGKKYEVEVEKLEAYKSLDRNGVAAPAAPVLPASAPVQRPAAPAPVAAAPAPAPAPAPAAQPAATAQPAFTPATGDSASLPFDDPTSAHPNIAVNDPAGDLDIPDFLR